MFHVGKTFRMIGSSEKKHIKKCNSEKGNFKRILEKNAPGLEKKAIRAILFTAISADDHPAVRKKTMRT